MSGMGTDEVLELMVDVAEQVINPRFRALAGGEVDEKTPGDFVTVADREAEELLTAALVQHYPDCLVVGEEASFARPELIGQLAGAEHAFTVDPVDGTGNFVKGSPRHAVMIAEVRRGEVTRSWIWQPQFEVAWVAERGAGLTRNGVPVSRGPARDLPLGATSRHYWHGFDGDGTLSPVVDATFCAGVDYPMMLTGELDYLLYLRPKPWDHLPGLLMVRETGGTTLEVNGHPYGPATPKDTTIVAAATPDVARLVARHWGPDKR